MSTDVQSHKRPIEKLGIDEYQQPQRKRVKRAVINYRPGENLFDMFKPGKVVTVFIPKKYLISAIEDEEERKIWGTDTYTDASDIIAVCQHTGKLNLSDINRYQSFINGALVDVRIREPLKNYKCSYRNHIRSRSWSNHDGNAYSIEYFRILQDKIYKENIDKQAYKIRLQRTKAELEQARFVPNVSIVFDLCNEPCLKYSLNLVADKGFEENEFFSYRLKNEVVYVETLTDRYELSFDEKRMKYKWCHVQEPLMDQATLLKQQIPLEAQCVKVLHDDLEWKDIQWGFDSVIVKRVRYNLHSIRFVKRKVENAPKSVQEIKSVINQL